MPLDTRIALGVQPLQVQFRDPMASYNQLAQLQSADTQNQLAQMQMQEARQLAPLRMQEQQSRAAAAKLTLDDAIEAQTYIKSVMAKAAEASNGTATKDPFEAAKQMMNHPNSQVQAAGLRLLESSQKLIAFENQMANERAYAEDQRGGAPAPVAEALSADNVKAPMVGPGTPAPNVASALSRFVSGTKTTPEGDVAPYFSIGGQPASEDEYTRQKEAIMLPQPANALAPAAAPPVNAMAKKAVNPLQDAAALMKQIQDGDDRFARGGTPAPGWKNKRELLMKAFEQAVKVERNQNQRYLSLGAGAALDTETRELIAKDRAPAAAAAPKIFNVRGIPHTLNEEGNLVPVPVEGGALPTPVAAQPQAVAAPRIINYKGVPYTFNFETGRLEPVPVEGGVSTAAAAQPQAVAAPRIINYKGAPHTLNEAGELVPIPVAGGVLPAAVAAQPPAATGVKPDIRIIKGIPYTFNADTGKFVRVPVEGGLPATAGKGGTGKQATADKPKPPIGYRYDASGENLEPIPGGPASEKLQPKEIQQREAKYPQAISALKSFEAKTSKLERDIDELIANKDGLNEITGYIAGRTDLSAMSNAGRRALAKFNTITAKGGFSELQDMRNASPTGGALGNVSNQEGQQLVAAFGTLSRTQNADDLRSSLTTIKSDLQGSKQRVKEAFDETYAYRANRGKSAAPAVNVDDLLDKYK